VTADEDGVAMVPLAKAADVLKKSQDLDDTEHRMLPFIEKFRSINEAASSSDGFDSGAGRGRHPRSDLPNPRRRERNIAQRCRQNYS
jgi:hypothetical protein